MSLHLVLLKCLFRLQRISLFKKLTKNYFFHYLTCFPENFTIKSLSFTFGVLFHKILTNRRHTPPHQKKIHVIKTQIKLLNKYNPPAIQGLHPTAFMKNAKRRGAHTRIFLSSAKTQRYYHLSQ